MMCFNVLLVEDSEEDRINFLRIVNKLNETSETLRIRPMESNTLEEALSLMDYHSVDIVLLDLSLPDSEGLEGIKKIQTHFGSKFPIIVLTGQESEKTALEAIKSGAQDYLQKREITPFSLKRSIRYAFERSETAKELERIRIDQAKSLKMATLGEMAGGIAHEINNPLSIILGFADRIKRKSATGMAPEELISYATKIELTTNRMAKIVKGLKAYSRKEDNDPFGSARLINIVEDTLSLCSEKFKTASIELIIGEIFDVELLCKDIQLSQVLLNLLHNAHDAIQNSNEKWVRLFSQLDNDHLHLYVVDSGEIVDDVTRKNIFAPFFTTKAKGEGTGLGMSISKSIIEEHQGVIELVESERNTTFRVSLPILIKNSQAA